MLYIDTGGDFYPPAAAQLGVPLEQLLIIRPHRNSDALWVCEQALRCPAVAAVVLPIRTVDTYISRRLQLAAETGGGLGFLLRSETRGGPTFAATCLRLDPLPSEKPAPYPARNEATIRSAPQETHREEPQTSACAAPRGPKAAALRVLPAVPRLPTVPPADSSHTSAARRMRVALLKHRDGRLAEPFELALPTPWPA